MVEGKSFMKSKLIKFIGVLFVCAGLGILITSQHTVSANEKTEATAEVNIIKCPYYETGSQNENEEMPQFIIKMPSASNDTIIPMSISSKGILNVILFETKELSEDTASQ